MTGPKRWNRFVAGILSLIIPGLGQLYKSQLLNAIVWFVLTGIGYALFVFPGIILHVFCIVGALSGDESS
jgi:TM2 domain-containing membrane protein YozV